MKLITFKADGKEQVGVLSKCKTKVFPVKNLKMNYSSMNELIENISDVELEELSAASKANCEDLCCGCTYLMLKDVEILAPIPQPKQDVICIGINYMAHAEESARYKEEAFGGERPYAVYFSKRINYASADGDFIPAHEDICDSLDYEVELAVIIGKEAKNVKKEDAFKHVFGYTIINDVSARTLQTRHKQWYFGKSLDGFFPMGPSIVTKDEFAEPPIVKIQSRVNGEVRQDSTTELLIFTIEHVISELSQGMTLKPGTIIAMGTPAGVGMGFTPPKWLKPGDVVECEIEGIGCLTNTVK